MYSIRTNINTHKGGITMRIEAYTQIQQLYNTSKAEKLNLILQRLRQRVQLFNLFIQPKIRQIC